MKRIVTLILTMSILLSIAVFNTGYAAETQSIKESSYCEKAASFLGVLNFKKFSTSMNEEISRGEFTNLLLSLLKISKTAGTDERIFQDIPVGSTYYGATAVAYQLGYVGGYKGNFRPADTVTAQEAVKMLVTALDYGEYAERSGGYPAGYLAQAERLELFKGVPGLTGPITYGQAAALLFNMLIADQLQLTSVAEDRSNYTVNEDGFLGSLYSIYCASGLVSGNQETLLDRPEPALPEGYVMVGGTRYVNSLTNADDLLGQEIRYYYREQNGEEPELIYVWESLSNVVEISAEDIVEFDGSELRYLTDGKDSDVTIPSNAYSFFNGRAKGIEDESALMFRNGRVRLIENRQGEVTSVMVECYVNYVVDNVSSQGILSDKNGQPKLDLDDEDKISIYDSVSGKKLGYDVLEPWDVLMVYADRTRTELDPESGKYIHFVDYDNSEQIKLIRCRNTVEGRVQELMEGDRRIVVRNVVFDLSVEAQNGNYDLKPGAEGTFYMNQYNEICACSKIGSNTGDYAYLMGLEKGSALSTEVRMKVLSSSGNIEFFTLTGKIGTAEGKTVDSEKLMEDPNFVDRATQKTIKQLIYYERNWKGDISKLYHAMDNLADTNGARPYSLEDSVFTKDYENTIARYYVTQALESYRVSPTTVIFTIPEDESMADDDSAYGVKNGSYLVTDKDYDIKLYDADSERIAKAAVLKTPAMTDSGTVDRFASTAMIDKITRAVNKDGEVKYLVHMLYNGKENKFFLADETVADTSGVWSPTWDKNLYQGVKAIDLQQGDVIQFGTNTKNEITAIRILFRHQAVVDAGHGESYEELRNNGDWSATEAPDRFAHAEMYVAYTKINEKYSSAAIIKPASYERYLYIPEAVVYIHQGEKVSVGTINDLSEDSVIFFRMHASIVKEIHVYL